MASRPRPSRNLDPFSDLEAGRAGDGAGPQHQPRDHQGARRADRRREHRRGGDLPSHLAPPPPARAAAGCAMGADNLSRGPLARNQGPRPGPPHAPDRPPRRKLPFPPRDRPVLLRGRVRPRLRDRPRHPPPPRALPPGVRPDRAAPRRRGDAPCVPLRGRTPIAPAVHVRGVLRVQRRVRPGPGGLGPVRRRDQPRGADQRRPRGGPAIRTDALRLLIREAVRPSLPPTFLVAGAGELPEGVLAAGAIVRAGDTPRRGSSPRRSS